MLKSDNPSIKRILGVTPGMGKALGVDEKWVYNIVKQVGNYGESFDRNVGMGSPLKIARGEDFQSLNTAGLYPAGEGASYAGGILSAGVDGIKVGEAVARKILTTP